MGENGQRVGLEADEDDDRWMDLYDLFEGCDWVERTGGTGGVFEFGDYAFFRLEHPTKMK